MTLLSFFKKEPPALLKVFVDGAPLCIVTSDSLPCELAPAAAVRPDSEVLFLAADGTEHKHSLGGAQGWAHFSVRVHRNLACQSDCVVTNSPQFDADAFSRGEALGVRFQPFFLPGGNVTNSELRGKGLFARGLHFNGRVTPGNILLSCECDCCHRSFVIRSYHAGFSNSGYFYSGSGKYTLTVSSYVAGAPAALAEPEPAGLAALEARLPEAPDGSRFAYLNPFRCPYCSAPYIDFAAHPGSRVSEYYGNYFAGFELLRYEPAES
ncbi:hypothetical protein EJMOOK_13575 [Rhodanobacter sp. Root179]